MKNEAHYLGNGVAVGINAEHISLFDGNSDHCITLSNKMIDHLAGLLAEREKTLTREWLEALIAQSAKRSPQ